MQCADAADSVQALLMSMPLPLLYEDGGPSDWPFHVSPLPLLSHLASTLDFIIPFFLPDLSFTCSPFPSSFFSVG